MMPASNWLSFAMSPMEMMRTIESPFMAYEGGDSSTGSVPHYFVDNFYAANVYGNTKSHVIFTEQDIETNQNQQQTMTTDSSSPSYTSYTNFFNHPHSQTQTIPKLEYFFSGAGDSVSMIPFSDSKTETQDSTLTHFSDHGETYYFNDQQDLKSITACGIQTTTNSGSDVDDSVSITMTEKIRSKSVNELGFSLSMNSNQTSCSEKAIVSVAAAVAVGSISNNSSKKVTDSTSFGQRTSIYRGVTRHRWTGRYEAHLWDNSCRREGQARKGRQVYLGGYDMEDKAARAYDLAALKYWGPAATTNFPITSYTKEVEEMKHVTKQEFIASIRRKSSGFSRGASVYRGVTRHHQQGRWQARIGRVAGNKDLYLGTFATEEEAAEAYDIAAIKFRGLNAVTNFEMNRYDVEAISNCSLPIGGASKRLKVSLEDEEKASGVLDKKPQCSSASCNINFAAIQPSSSITPYAIPLDGSASAIYHQNMYHKYQISSESPLSTSSGTNAVSYMPSPTEYFLWPHQSY